MKACIQPLRPVQHEDLPYEKIVAALIDRNLEKFAIYGAVRMEPGSGRPLEDPS